MQRILVIEDEDDLREEIADLIRFEGYEVFVAADGLQGVEQAQQLAPDLIVSDVMMPGMDGFSVLMALQDFPETRNIPFIFLTAKASQDDLRMGMGIGADDYLTKPFRRDELIGAIQLRLEKQQRLSAEFKAQVEEMRQTVFSTMPHEFRTPLTGLMGAIDMALDIATEQNHQILLEMLDVMRRTTQRLYQLTENYLLFNQLQYMERDENRKNFTKQLQNFTPTTHEEIMRVATQKAQDYNRLADMTCDLQAVHLAVVKFEFTKLVSELVDNAFKFSKAGSAVYIHGEQDGQYYLIAISDSGRGMHPHQLKQIDGLVQFERKQYEQQGSGLGLVIAKHLTELQGGQFAIQSQLERGTTVTLRLPVDH